MKKINNLEISALVAIITITMYSGININLIKNSTRTNSCISIIISYLIGIVPLILYLYISKYEEKLPLKDKIAKLFKSTHYIINPVLNIILAIIGITIIYNISNFITSQLLYRTPQIIIGILLTILVIYNVTKGINTITKVSLIMTFFNIFLFLVSFFALIKHINLENFLPILKNNTSCILPNALKLASINALPLILLLCIPKENTEKPEKYSKYIILSYIISSLISFLIFFATYGTLGTYLTNIFEYPEYIVLKKVVLFGFLERIENIVSNQWLVGDYIYLTIIIYYLSTSSCLSKKINNKFLSLNIGITLLILSTIIFKSSTIFNNYIKTYFPYITASLFIIYLIITLKIFITKKNHRI